MLPHRRGDPGVPEDLLDREQVQVAEIELGRAKAQLPQLRWSAATDQR